VKIFDPAQRWRYPQSMRPCAISLLLVALVPSVSLSLADSTIDELHAKAERGDVNAQAKLTGNIPWDFASRPGVAKDLAENINWYRKVAEQGEPGSQWAQWELGMACVMGAGVAQDYAEAVRWYRKAAEQNFAKAQYWLGTMYETGRGVTKDPAEAIRCYRKAAEQGESIAQYGLGAIYGAGIDVAKDPAESLKWYIKAAEQGYTPAQDWLGDMYSKG
jgi:uncharacterized protein